MPKCKGKKENKRIIYDMGYFIFFFVWFLLLVKYPSEILSYVFDSMFIYTVFTLSIGISTWAGFTDLMYTLENYKKDERQI